MSAKWSLREDKQQEVGETTEEPIRDPFVYIGIEVGGQVSWGGEGRVVLGCRGAEVF